MGKFDQSARWAMDLEKTYFLGRILQMQKLTLEFRQLFDARTVPLPAGPERIADLVASLGPLRQDEQNQAVPEPPNQEDEENLGWLLVFEIQTRHDEGKLKVLLMEAMIFSCYARDPDNNGKPFRVLPVLVYLTGKCPRTVVDHRTPVGDGIRCQSALWELEKDSALGELRKVESGEVSWDALFWTILMNGAGGQVELDLWKRLLDTKVPAERRADVAFIALQFAELNGCLTALEGVLGDQNMAESSVYDRAVNAGRAAERIVVIRANLLSVLERLYPGEVPVEYQDIIRKQESFDLLEVWWRAAMQSKTAAEFLDEMRR